MKLRKLLLSMAVIVSALTLGAQNIYIVGDATDKGWTLSEPDEMKFTYNQSDDRYEWTGDLKQGGVFRFITGANWYPTYTTAQNQTSTVSAGEYALSYDENARAGEPAFRILKGGNYTITLDTKNLKMNLTANEIYAPELCIIGSGSPAGWNTERAQEFKFTRTGNASYHWEGVLNTSDGGRFRFLTEGGWWPSYTTSEKNSEYPVEPGNSYVIKYYDNQPTADNAFSITESGYYSIDILLTPDDENTDYYPENDFERGTMTINKADLMLYLCGNAGPAGWNLDKAMDYPLVKMENGHYSWSGNLKTIANTNATFRFLTGHGWYPAFAPDSDGDMKVYGGNSYNMRYRQSAGNSFEITESGNYTLDLDVFSGTPLLTVTRNGDVTDEPVVEHKELYICGNALCGKDGVWELTDDFVKPMTASENEGEYVWDGKLYGGYEFKFRDYGKDSGSWDGWVSNSPDNLTVAKGQTYPIHKTGDGVADSKFIAPEDGNYSIKVNTKLGNMTIKENTTTSVETIIIEDNKTVHEIFNLNGVKMTDDKNALSPGIYIERKNGKTSKIVIR